MGCNCGGNTYGGTSSNCNSPCEHGYIESCHWSNVVIPVETLPSPEHGTRKCIYLLPNNRPFILDHDGVGWIELSTVATVIE